MTLSPTKIPYCTKDLRHYLKPVLTTDELFNLKQYFYYQKHLALRLINYQRLLTSQYNSQGSRYNYRLYIDRKTFQNLGFSPIRSNPNLFVMNEKRFNQILNIHRNDIKPPQSKQSIEHEYSVLSPVLSTDKSISDTETILPKLNTCSTLIAVGHGKTKIIYPPTNTDIEQTNTFQTRYGWKDEDISLSKTCKRIVNRPLFRRQINSKPSTIHLFTTGQKIIQNNL